MTARRVMGVETEYGIVAGADADPTVLSAQLVTAYATAMRQGGGGWDYLEESPLRDVRGFDLAPAAAPPSLLSDDDPTMINAVLTNGARFYVDHAHPEYSAPETVGPTAAVIWDKAGELVLARAADLVASSAVSTGARIACYKNNTDGKGASYGTHENYLTTRATPFGSIVAGLTPFLVTRQVFAGAGRVGIGQAGQHAGFQIASRSDFIEAEVGLETTSKRPIVNTRDEPHADPARHRRLHIILGDANCAELPTFLKLGTTSLVLAMIEAGVLDVENLRLADPLKAIRAISHDPSLRETIETADGRRLTAVELQLDYLDLARKFLDDRFGADLDAETQRVLHEWGEVLDDLAVDPMRCADRLDWVAKLSLLESYRERDGLDWTHAKLALVDLQYSDVRPARGLYHRLVGHGRMRRLVDDTTIAAAEHTPPADTRAWFRGECVRRYGRAVAAASWDSVVLDSGHAGSALQRVPTPDPERGTKAMVSELLDRCPTPALLLEELSQRRDGSHHAAG